MQLPRKMSLTAHGCTAGPPLKNNTILTTDRYFLHYRQVEEENKSCSLWDMLHMGRVTSHVHSAFTFLHKTGSGIKYQDVCVQISLETIPFQINWMLDYTFFFHWERGDNKSRNKPRAQLKMKPEGEQRKLITKAHPFEATFTRLLFPPAEAILQSFIKKASLQRNYLKQRSYGGFRTNENKTAGN